MAFVRIIADGHGLLREWTDLAPGQPRLSAAAGEELLLRLTRYYDAIGTPITVVFEGALPGADADEPAAHGDVEVVTTRAGQTTEQLIKRLAYRHRPAGEVLVITDHAAAPGAGGLDGAAVSGCAEFIRTVETTLVDVERKISQFNQEERNKYLRAS
jgi:predicted RNA-binding protein with PIN domain